MRKRSTTKLAVFNGSKIRKVIHKNEWYFVVEDIVNAVIDSKDPKQYIKRMKSRDPELRKGWVQIVPTLLVETSGGKQKMACSNTEGCFRIIQSITSPKAEPFKRWLAKVGYERVKEIENPELAIRRTKAIYKARGYSDSWIEKRMRGIAIREELTDEWHKRGAKGREYGILTSEIAKATFDISPQEHKKIKNLKRANLRDHMTDLELILNILGETTTTQITKTRNSKKFPKLEKDAQDGGSIAGETRRNIEKLTKKKTVSSKNFLPKRKTKKLK